VKFRKAYYCHPSTPIDFFAKSIAEVILSQPSPLKDLEVFMEPGRWLSNSSMHILLRVLERKGSDIIIADGGINLLGWERPINEFIPVINLSKSFHKERDVRIFGPLCTPDDIWGYSVFGSDVSPGDILLIPDQGAYTYSLRQSFIKPIARVIKYDGYKLEQIEMERSK
jgi:diaminopimelate decarboxylase